MAILFSFCDQVTDSRENHKKARKTNHSFGNWTDELPAREAKSVFNFSTSSTNKRNGTKNLNRNCKENWREIAICKMKVQTIKNQWRILIWRQKTRAGLSRKKFVWQYFKKLSWFNQLIVFKLREIIFAIYNLLF